MGGTDRRGFLQSAGMAALAAMAPLPARAAEPGGVRLALNVYSFNQPLRAGEMTLEDVVDYCARHRLYALDATGYYFPGYPQAPADEYIYRLKRRAFLQGIDIHGTGVRNDFAVADPAARAADVELVKNWIVVAQKLGASIIRVFSGRAVPAGRSFDEVLEWMVPLFKDCADYGRRHGVMLALQNHDDFLKTADETIRLVEAVDSEWFRVLLDIGSLRRHDPYQEIARLVPYAVSWQLKENVGYGKKETPVDLVRLKRIIDEGGYRGYLPIETLGPGDPRVKVARFLERVRAVFS